MNTSKTSPKTNIFSGSANVDVGETPKKEKKTALLKTNIDRFAYQTTSPQEIRGDNQLIEPGAQQQATAKTLQPIAKIPDTANQAIETMSQADVEVLQYILENGTLFDWLSLAGDDPEAIEAMVQFAMEQEELRKNGETVTCDDSI